MKLSKNTKNSLFVFIMAFSAFFAFEPLFEHLGQKAAQEFAVAIFGTIFAAVITMVLLNRQTETEEERSRSDKVFEQKLILYNQVIDTLEDMFGRVEDSFLKVDKRDIVKLEFLLARMMMVASNKIIYEFKYFYETVTNSYSTQKGGCTLMPGDRQIVFRFADYCREELGLSDKNLEKEILEDIVLQGELVSNIPKMNEIPSDVMSLFKDIYGYLIFDLEVRSNNIEFRPFGFRVRTGRTQLESKVALECYADYQQVYLLSGNNEQIKGFAVGQYENRSAVLIHPVVLTEKKSDFSAVEQYIRKALG